MINPDIFCHCDHPYNMHKVDFIFGWAHAVPPVPKNVCLVSNNSEVYHECVFKMDNLVYLEWLAEKKRNV